jgi:hypothetical protein
MRFRLKTEFLTFARDQIRGGLWYKVRRSAGGGLLASAMRCHPATFADNYHCPRPNPPPRSLLQPTWWDAVTKVPPSGFVPRVKKADIPHVRFVEDRLIRCVRGRAAGN